MRLGRTSLLAVALVAYAATAAAEPVACQRSILKESTKLARVQMKALRKCEDQKLRGKLSAGTDCATETATAPKIAKAASKLRRGLTRTCGGPDRTCGTGDDEPLGAIGWPSTCPDFQSLGCTNAIAGCDDVADCLVCIDTASTAQVAALAFPDAPAPGGDALACQRALGKEIARFFDRKTKALGACWDARHKGAHANACPSPGDGKTAVTIAKAASTARAKICRACGGPDRACGGGDDVAPFTAGFPPVCPNVATCHGLVDDLDAAATCADCVTEFDVDCAALLAVPAFASYPATCAAPPLCPTTLRLDGDADAVDLDIGWPGFVHDLTGPWLGSLTLLVSDCAGSGDPTCGACSLEGPVPNVPGEPSAGTRRCANQPWVVCGNDNDCAAAGAGGACRFFFGPPQPIAESGGTRCALYEIRGPVSGTVDVEAGALEVSLPLFTRTGLLQFDLSEPSPAVSNPCPRCVAGLCDTGPRAGMPCTVQGYSTLFAADLSLDCPPAFGFLAHALPVSLTTGTRTLTLGTTSPTCSAAGFSGTRCHCDTCATAAFEPCHTDADCPGATPGSCGGRRCLGGAASGTPCTTPGFGDPACASAPCGFVGEPTKPNACNDVVCTAGGGDGSCALGPFDGRCEPTETFRSCIVPSDCPVAGDTCVFVSRPCLPGSGTIGDTVSVSGAPDAPSAGTFAPVLADIGCLPVEASTALFDHRSLPGPFRVELGVAATLE